MVEKAANPPTSPPFPPSNILSFFRKKKPNLYFFFSHDFVIMVLTFFYLTYVLPNTLLATFYFYFCYKNIGQKNATKNFTRKNINLLCGSSQRSKMTWEKNMEKMKGLLQRLDFCFGGFVCSCRVDFLAFVFYFVGFVGSQLEPNKKSMAIQIWLFFFKVSLMIWLVIMCGLVWLCVGSCDR